MDLERIIENFFYESNQVTSGNAFNGFQYGIKNTDFPELAKKLAKRIETAFIISEIKVDNGKN